MRIYTLSKALKSEPEKVIRECSKNTRGVTNLLTPYKNTTKTPWYKGSFLLHTTHAKSHEAISIKEDPGATAFWPVRQLELVVASRPPSVQALSASACCQ